MHLGNKFYFKICAGVRSTEESILIKSNPDLSSIGAWLLHCGYSMALVGLPLVLYFMKSMGLGDELQLSNQFTIRRKWKHDRDSARKVCLKYKK